MSAIRPHELRRQRAELVRRAHAANSHAEVFAAASRRLRALVPHDAAAWLMTDPGTGLPTAPSRIEGVPASAELCTEHWRRELADHDINRFRDLARSVRPAAALRASVGDPQDSPRYRRFLQPFGFHDELRAVLRVGSAPWATVTLWRRQGAESFSRTETDLVAGLSAPLCEALLRCTREEVVAGLEAATEPAGLLLFDDAGRLTSANAYAETWLAELPPDDRVATSLGLRLPVWLLLIATQAHDSLRAGGDGTSRTRVRSLRGRWIVGHASCTSDGSGAPAGTAVLIEPASPALVAPIIAETYGLTKREQTVTRLLARGAGTAEIARSLFLSPHTVRDHVKAILAKVGVSSRGELVATIYAHHYQPIHLAAGSHQE